MLARLLAIITPALMPGLGPAVTAHAADAGASAKAFEADVKPLLKKYCFDCHGRASKEAGLNLERFDNGTKAIGERPFWEGAIKRIRDKEMPPEGSDQPSEEERKKMLDWVANLPKLDDCRQLATDETQNFYRGYVMSRRLNRAEYNNSIRDLFGLDLRPADSFPADGAGGEGFDTAGAALFTSPIHLEKYLSAADEVVRVVLPDSAEGLSADVAAARARVLFVTPGESVSPREAARQIVATFTNRAFRRPATDEEVDRLLTMFDRAQQRGDGFVPSLRLALKAMLISPHFLFLVEPEPEQDGVYRLGHYQIAQRLASFLWASLPDDELLELARTERLHDDEVLRQQVRRMLKDPKSRGLAENFTLQWLGIGALGTTIRPDAGKFPEFDAALAEAMREETVLFVNEVFREDRSLLDLIDADYTYVNARLAKLYGLPEVSGEALQRVSLPDRTRGGIVSQASVLTTTSYPLRTSPVLRGRWVLEEVLGSRVPPPPPNVPALEESGAAATAQTLRQRLEEHRKKADCAACHNRMDPLGFGLENFDPIGRWRTEDAGQPVDASGKLPSGEMFSGPAELKKILLKRRWDFQKNLTRKMLGYALGRELNKFDQCVVDETMKALEKNGHRSSVLFEQIVLSYPFQYRYVRK